MTIEKFTPPKTLAEAVKISSFSEDDTFPNVPFGYAKWKLQNIVIDLERVYARLEKEIETPSHARDRVRILLENAKALSTYLEPLIDEKADVIYENPPGT